MLSRSLPSTCRRNAFRSFATAVETPGASVSTPPPRPNKTASTKPQAAIKTAVLLNRSPIITRTPTPFEKSYYAYQHGIQRALHNPFPHEFYFKPGAPLETQFNLEEAKRDRKAFGKNFGADAEDAFTKPENAPKVAEDQQSFAARRTAADESGDVKSLDRHGQRNLYLLLARKEGGKQVWSFPTGDLNAGELLHESAERGLAAQVGSQANTWVVSRNPIGVIKPSKPSDAHTFFYKAHIMAGQLRPDGKEVVDFAWLTKQEIEGKLPSDVWTGVKDMLSDF